MALSGGEGEGAPLGGAEVEAFRALIYGHYRESGRRLPWRETRDPYAVVVSELMLQQTQVQRVLQKYPSFLAAFPTFAALARAPLAEVLAQWQGLGYNRRALLLHRCAREVDGRLGGVLPCEVGLLESLPGIGHYTARAVAAFACGEPTVFIETNIRAVFLHRFFPGRSGVADREILPLVACTLDRRDPRNWYYALMDFGALLKRQTVNPGRRSAHHARQSPFRGSNREERSRILQAVLAEPGLTRDSLLRTLGTDPERAGKNLARLMEEGFLREEGGALFVA